MQSLPTDLQEQEAAAKVVCCPEGDVCGQVVAGAYDQAAHQGQGRASLRRLISCNQRVALRQLMRMLTKF